MQNYGAMNVQQHRRGMHLMLIAGIVLLGLVAALSVITYARSQSLMAPVETFQMLDVGNEFLVSRSHLL